MPRAVPNNVSGFTKRLPPQWFELRLYYYPLKTARSHKIEFDTQVEHLEIINASQQIEQFEDNEESRSWKDTLIQVARLSPRAAIIEAWTSIELACIEAGMQRGTVGPMRFYPKMLEEFLYKTEGFDQTMIQQIMEMRRLRNLVIHGRDQEFGFLDSDKYINLADKVLTAIKAQQLIQPDRRERLIFKPSSVAAAG